MAKKKTVTKRVPAVKREELEQLKAQLDEHEERHNETRYCDQNGHDMRLSSISHCDPLCYITATITMKCSRCRRTEIIYAGGHCRANKRKERRALTAMNKLWKLPE